MNGEPGNLHEMYSGALRLVLRVVLVVLAVAVTTWATWVFHGVLQHLEGEWIVLDTVLLAMFAVLFFWIAFSFWTAVAGLMQLLRRDQFSLFPISSPYRPVPRGYQLPRTAIVMPIYNENPAMVFATVQAMHASLARTGHEDRFDFHVLSDTNNPQIAQQEQRAYQILQQRLGPDAVVHYRRREQNTGGKSGNLDEFCHRCRQQYECMLVLDADSVMTGPTIVEMARRMRGDPKLGILQAPLKPVGRHSLFARMQQFAASVYAEVYTAGFALWTQSDSNYFGHNALIRLQPFVEHCELPTLPGDPPLGGQILSHDFVEAALMRRAGYTVRMAWDLIGSYEQVPTRLIDFARRDQRWCQGNMQHLRVLAFHGLHPVSRWHLVTGVMSYLSSPLWLMMMLIGAAAALAGSLAGFNSHNDSSPVVGVGLFVLTLAMLFLPRFFAFMSLVLDRPRQEAHGRDTHIAFSVLIECVFSALIAPILMLFHSRFVLNIFRGRSIRWNRQPRDDSGTGWREAAANFGWSTIIGLVALIGGSLLLPQLLWWFSPIWGGLCLSIPLAVILDSPAVGRWLQRHRLLLIPEEIQPPRILRHQSLLTERYDALLRDEAAPASSASSEPGDDPQLLGATSPT
ncbi:MAG: glucans biosynthesis glucosyltransferase MdoH [Phycisphaeraceae bacterium]|nr:glucans biosynthesis glucosyltransferase MdoH [Phycisphaeraceae bacterium]